MRSAFYTAITLSILLPLAAHADVYRCDQNGQTTFSDEPCGEDAKNLGDVQATQVGGSMGSRLSNEFFEERSRERGLEHINNEIDDLEDVRVDLRESMRSELARLEQKRQQANNNLAGAVWENSLTKDKKAIQEKWQSRIQEVNEEIAYYRQKRQELQAR